ncbi:hypothetical protein BDR07DRAFT_1413728 [Suillus spraguei]|nr:hypothetical protein BDR07DRAFT_1413728 [Suillus spraguei]
MTANDTPGMVGKRKLGMKFMSVTPSVIDDNDEERDMKRRKAKAGDVSALGGSSSSAVYDTALTLMDEDKRLQRGRARNVIDVISDDEYLMASDEE